MHGDALGALSGTMDMLSKGIRALSPPDPHESSTGPSSQQAGDSQNCPHPSCPPAALASMEKRRWLLLR